MASTTFDPCGFFSDTFLENTEFAWLGGSASAVCASGDWWLSSAGTIDVEGFHRGALSPDVASTLCVRRPSGFSHAGIPPLLMKPSVLTHACYASLEEISGEFSQ